MLVFLASSGCAKNTLPAVKAENGKINLSEWNIDNNGAVDLAGEWEFYAGVLLTPDDFASKTISNHPEFVKVPGSINNTQITSQEQLKVGHTFRLTVALKNPQDTLGIYMPDFSGASRVWVNGSPIYLKKSYPTGKPASPQASSNVIGFFETTENSVEIIIQSSNFKTEKILLGSKEQILKQKIFPVAVNISIFCIILFMGLYHFSIFFLRKKDKAYLYTGIFCSAASVYTSSLIPDPVLFLLFPHLSFVAYYTIAILSSVIANLFIIIYINSLYPNEINKYIVKTIKFVAIIFSILFIFIYTLNHGNVYWVMKPYEVIFSFVSIYLFYVLYKAQQKNKGALIVLAGYAILFSTSCIDTFSSIFIIGVYHLNKYGWLVFIMFQTFTLSLNFTRTFTKVEQMSEKLTSLDKLKDEFLVNTAHELKTPMHGIIGIAETMLDQTGYEEKKQSQNLSLIIASARRLTELVNNILDFSKMKHQDIVLHNKSLNLWQVVDVVFAVLRPMAKEKELIFKNEISESLNVYADENRLFQILYNLLGNAVKFTESGEIKVLAVKRNQMIQITVSDTGMGIPEDKLETVFLPFEQVEIEGNSANSGTGLGLSITKNLVELHGGSIHVESQPGKGSSFIFSLPPSYESAQNSKPNKGYTLETNSVDENDNPQTDNTEFRILIADDEPINLQIFINLFRKENYAIQTANNGFEALQAVEVNGKPDLVILDVMMPKMSGYEVCRKLREQYPIHDLPILLVTVKNQPADILAGFEAGANDYLTKPFQTKELKARIKNLLDLKKAVNSAVTSQLNFLQAQIKPHFLYNTLNAIMSLVRTDQEKARDLLLELSNYLRESFRFKGTEKSIPLKKEISIVKSYLYIVMARFPGKISTIYDIDENIDINIPHLIIQPIVENAVKHGILPKPDGGTIHLAVKDKGSHVLISVQDDGAGIQKEMVSLLLSEKINSTSVGLVNVNKRLLALYGTGVSIESEPEKGTRIILKIPMKGCKSNEGYIAG
ncbi:MAG: ATP-binding protein [Clostridia bacterium]|nr:ATP-binding protein [Clostridia bacterium]